MSPLALAVYVDLSWRALGFLTFALVMVFGGMSAAWFVAGSSRRCVEVCCRPQVSDRYRGRRRTRRQPTGPILPDGYEPPSGSLNPNAHVTAPVRRTSDHPDATVILQRIKDQP